MAAADCTSEADQLNDNSRVGYYVDDDGFLRYKPTASYQHVVLSDLGCRW